MKYLILKPRGNSSGKKQYVEFEKSKVNNVKTFIQQQIGAEPVERLVGDYLLWISNPEEQITGEFGETFTTSINYDNSDLKANLLVNEFDIAYGNVVVTSNYAVTKDRYGGLTEHDIANIMNAFTKSNTRLIDQGENQYVVDSITESILNPNGRLIQEEIEVPQIKDLGEFSEEVVSEVQTYSDEIYEEPVVINDIDQSMSEQLNDEELQERLKEL